MIPIYMMEEHNEAFYYWKKAICDGFMPESGNILLHVDHHDDLEYGGYFHNFKERIKSPEEAEQFTYECLGIADFIIPAVYEGFFDCVLNMKDLLPTAWKKQEKIIKRTGDNALLVQNYIPFLHSGLKKGQEEKYCFFSCFEGSLSELPVNGTIVLDIDLDYFCWDDSLSGAEPKRMEITQEAYRNYKNDRYHPFRILPKRLFIAEEENGKFYLTYREPMVEEKKTDLKQIQKRMDRFLSWLKQINLQPCVIDICRSVKSGYMPADVVEFVEEYVLGGLKGMYLGEVWV